MDGATTGAGPRTAVTGREAPYLPPMGREWLLPLYDPVSRLMGVRAAHRRLLEQAGIGPGQRVLEVGCGTGNLVLLAKALHPSAEVVGLDPDLAALARARRKARRRRLALQLDRGFASALPHPDAAFDHVLCAFTLHHLDAGERQPALREVVRVLRPGGALHLVDIGGPADGTGHLAHVLQRNPRLRANSGDAVPGLLRSAGLVDVTETARERSAFGPTTYWRATR